MATLTMKNGDIRQISFELMSRWEAIRPQIKLSGKSTYALIALKRKLVEVGDSVTEAFMTVGQSLGGEIDNQGRMQIPPEKVEEANKSLSEIALETTEIEYTPIVVGEDESLPIDLMDLLFDFLEVK